MSAQRERAPWTVRAAQLGCVAVVAMALATALGSASLIGWAILIGQAACVVAAKSLIDYERRCTQEIAERIAEAVRRQRANQEEAARAPKRPTLHPVSDNC